MTPRQALGIEHYRLPLRKRIRIRIRRTLRALVMWLCGPRP